MGRVADSIANRNPDDRQGRLSYARLLKLLLVLVVVGLAVWAVVQREHVRPEALVDFVREAGAWGPVVFVFLYALAAIAFVPATIFALAGGALFGPVAGTLVNLAGATLGATLAFLIARHLASDWVRRKAGERLNRLLDGVASDGWRAVAFARLVPLFPFNLLNYALGLTRISLLQYVITSVVCMLPGTVAFTWLGHAGRQAVSGSGDAIAIRYGLISLGVLAALAFLPRMWRRRRKVGPVG